MKIKKSSKDLETEALLKNIKAWVRSEGPEAVRGYLIDSGLSYAMAYKLVRGEYKHSLGKLFRGVISKALDDYFLVKREKK